MLVKEAAAEVGSMTALAKLLGVDLSVLYRWGEELPESRFYQLEGLRAHGKMPKKKRERKVSA